MLKQIGLASAEELFHSIPEDLRLRGIKTPAALSESCLPALSGWPHGTAVRRTNFLGAGAYSHYIPTVVDAIISRSEFFTAYTLSARNLAGHVAGNLRVSNAGLPADGHGSRERVHV